MALPVPTDLEDALAAAPAAREQFSALSPEQMDDWVRWVEDARLPRARRRRVAEAVRRLSGQPVAAATVVETNGARPVALPRDSVWLWFLALVLLLVVGALIYWFAVRNDQHDSKPAASAMSTVPQVVGVPQQAAQVKLTQAKLAPTVVKVNAAKPRGIVVAQKPQAGRSVAQGSPVTIVVSNGPGDVKLPSLVGLTGAAAAKRLTGLNLTPTLKQVVSKKAPGTVIAQKPAAGTIAKTGTAVVLEVSKSQVAVPNLNALTVHDATVALQQAGLRATVAQVPSTQPQGTVVAQSPPAATKVAAGSAVRLNVSKGQQQTTTTVTQTQTTTQTATQQQSSSLPPAPPQGSGNDYRGMQLDPAVQKIAQGRQQAIVEYVASAKPAGIVVSNGTVGTKMRLSVSAGPNPQPATNLADVSGESAAKAQSELQSAGFTVVTVQWPVTDQSVDGTVVYETPTGGGKLPRGLAIVLYVASYSGG